MKDCIYIIFVNKSTGHKIFNWFSLNEDYAKHLRCISAMGYSVQSFILN